MCRLIALLVVGVTAATFAYAEEEKKATGKDDSAAAPVAAKTDKKTSTAKPDAEDPDKIDWSKVDWKKRLTRMQYYILREAGTEQAFKNKFWNFFKPGQYR